jgi:hypothetical protein
LEGEDVLWAQETKTQSIWYLLEVLLTIERDDPILTKVVLELFLRVESNRLLHTYNFYKGALRLQYL